MQFQHPLHERDQLIVPRFVGGVGEVDIADGYAFDLRLL